MSIEFHCEHCNKPIKALESTAGRNGKCPHCKGLNYIPLPKDEVGELPLAPIDEEFERRRKRAASEDAAIQRNLLHDRSAPGETGRQRSRNLDVAATGTVLSRKQVTSLIVSFIEAMSQGNLNKANQLSGQLSSQQSMVRKILDEMMTEDLTGYGLPTLPRPVLIGFLKQLRNKT
ncbi:MAG: hypothetical protein MI923_07780 [Phycisphaerales bacterium]|nr:hypothetical protein [Phycisphaerales bacterium]